MKNPHSFPMIHIIDFLSFCQDKIITPARTALAVEMAIDNELIKFLYALFQFCGAFIPITREGVLPSDRGIRLGVTPCFIKIHQVMVFSEGLFSLGR